MSDDVKAAAGCFLLFLDIGVGMFAAQRMRRSFWTWFFLSLLVSPVASFPFLMILGPQPSGNESQSPPKGS